MRCGGIREQSKGSGNVSLETWDSEATQAASDSCVGPLMDPRASWSRGFPAHNLAHFRSVLTGIRSGKSGSRLSSLLEETGVPEVILQWASPTLAPGFGASINSCSPSFETYHMPGGGGALL